MPRKVKCGCGAVNRVHEDAELSRTRCSACGARLAEPAGGRRRKEREEEEDEPGCFLCEQPVKGKRFTFYSGVKKGGTSHEMASCTVTFFERWSDLTMHEVQVCRDCQLRLWRQQQ